MFRHLSLAIAVAAAMVLSVPIAQAQNTKAPAAQKINFSTKAPVPMTPVPSKEPSVAWICSTGMGTCFVPMSFGIGSGCVCCTVFGCLPGAVIAEAAPPPTPVAQTTTEPPI